MDGGYGLVEIVNYGVGFVEMAKMVEMMEIV